MTDAATVLAADRRWKRFTSRDYTCPCCGERTTGLYDIGYDHPDPWPHGNRAASGETELVHGDDRLGTDLCRFDGAHFIRSTLPLPIGGSDEVFSFGPWVSVSEASFEAYVRAWDAEDFGDFPRCFGWLMNDLPQVVTEDWLPCDVEMGDGTKRPQIFIQPGAHPLADWQRDGISFDTLLDIYAAVGQDHRPHLGDA